MTDWDEYGVRVRKCEADMSEELYLRGVESGGYIDIDEDGPARIDGYYTPDELRVIAETIELFRGKFAAVNKLINEEESHV